MERPYLRLLLAFIRERELESLGQECHFAEALLQGVEVKFNIVKYLPIREKRNFRSVLFRITFSDNLQRIHGHAAFIPLLINLALFENADLQPLGERVDDRRAYAVQTAGYFVTPAAELSAGVKDCEHNFYGRDSGLMIYTNGNAASVVTDGDGIALVNCHFNMVAGTCKSLINRVVHYLIDEMMEASGRGGTDVHTRSLADCLKTFENLNLIGAILFIFFF